jgi:lysophospholipase L1-like esterase
MKTILCFGDSNTWGWDADNIDRETGLAGRFPWNVRWPGVMREILGGEYMVIEDALNGRTTAFNDPLFPKRSGLETLPTALECHAPVDLLILMLGGNDTKRMYNMSPGEITFGLDLLIQSASVRYAGGPPPRLLVICPPAMSEGVASGKFGFVFGDKAAQKSRELIPLYKEAARTRKCHCLDANECGATIGTTDYVHMTSSGHTLLGEAAAMTVKAIFGQG